jgi:large subunit ribosomal protein L10
MNKDQKAAVVDEIAEQFRSAEAVFAVDYRGISVAQAAELRERLRDADSRFRVVKNSLTERAADKAGMESIKPMLAGPTALTFVSGDAATAAKALNDAARAMQLLDFKGGMLGDSLLSADDVRSIARLPSRDVLVAQLVGTIAAPLSGLARTLNALVGGLAIQLQAMVDQGLVSGEAPAAEAAAEGAPAQEAPAAEAPAQEAAAAEAPAAEAEATPASEAEAPASEAEAPAPEAEAPAVEEAPAPESAEAEAPAETQATSETETSAASDAAESDD